MLKKKAIFILSLGVMLGVFIGLCGSVFADRANTGVAPETETLPYEDLRTFTEIYGRIKRDYVEPVSDKKLLEDAIRGMLSGLDPHSAYLGPEEYQELKEGTTGQFGGLGIEVTMENGFIKVVSPIDDTPAQKAGMKTGDLIIKLDEKPVKGMSLGDSVKMMRGEPGSKIVLTVVREGLDAPLKLTLTRDIIKVKSVKSRMLEKCFGYMRISSFQSSTGDGLKEALAALKKENIEPLKGLVLDLRNNPGGIFEASVTTVNAFLDQDRLKYDGLIVYTKGRIAKSEIKEYAKGKDILNNLPIVVLINGGSASASEIVAGALQDHKRAIILGTKSFGKGSVQTVLPLKDNRGLKLTTALYYTPSGRSIQATGITPDLLVENKSISTLNNNDINEQDLINIKESDLQGHLPLNNTESNKNNNNVSTDVETNKTTERDANNLKINKDYQLYQGLIVLKAMSILNSQR